jgi:hypothetical protein
LSLVEVKSGHVNVKNVREFIQVLKTKKADHGVFVCFKDKAYPNRYDKVQILTVEDILDGIGINLPLEQGLKKSTFKAATKSLTPITKEESFFD